jgi:hypothetical protein
MLVRFHQIYDPALSFHQIKELAQQAIRLKSPSRAEDDELLLGTGQRDVDSSPVTEKLSHLKHRLNQDKGFLIVDHGEGTHIADIVAPDHRDDDTILVSTLTLISRQDLDKRILYVDRG